MFYFAHPLKSPSVVDNVAAIHKMFGPGLQQQQENNNNLRSCGNYDSTTNVAATTAITEGHELQDEQQGRHVNETDRIRLASFAPWARETWSRESSVIAPLTELVAKRNGKWIAGFYFHLGNDLICVCN